jgi:hypothetical protein
MRSLVERIRRHSNLVLLLISGLLVPLLTNLASSWLEMTIGRTPNRLMQLLAIGVALVVGLWVLYLALERPGELWALYRALVAPTPVELVPEEERPPCFPGLIVLVGPGRWGADPEKLSHNPAIEYHLNCEEADGEPLRVCWLIATRGLGGSLPVAMEVKKQYTTDSCKFYIQPLDNAFDVGEAYQVVRRIHTQEAAKYDLTSAQIIADFTGGTKLMTVGMVLACLEGRWPMQYMSGRAGEIASTPILVRPQPTEAVEMEGVT